MKSQRKMYRYKYGRNWKKQRNEDSRIARESKTVIENIIPEQPQPITKTPTTNKKELSKQEKQLNILNNILKDMKGWI